MSNHSSPVPRSAALVLLLTTLLTLSVQAQQSPPPDDMPPPPAEEGFGPSPGRGPKGARQGPPPHRPPPSAAQLQQRFGLTAAQATDVERILREQRTRADALHERTRAEHERLRTETEARLKTALGADAYERFHKAREAHRPPHEGRRPPQSPRPRGEG